MKAEITRDRLIQQGIQALSRGGLASVTIGRLAEATGLSKSGFFAHFRSRLGLEIALLDESVALAWKVVVAPSMPYPEGLPRLQAVVDRWFGWPTHAGLIGGCPIAAALFELDDCEGPAREYVAKLEQEWRGFLEALVIRSVELGHLVPETDVSQFIWELCGIYLAHHSFTRFHHDPGTNQRAKHALEALLRRFEPQTSMSQEK